MELSERDTLNLARYEQHTIDVVLDRLDGEDVEPPAPHRVGGVRAQAHQGDWSSSSSSTPRRWCSSPRRWPAATAASASANSPRGTSPSTRPTAPVRCAPGSGRASRWTPISWCPTRRCRSAEGALAPWAGARFKYFERLIDGHRDARRLQRGHALEEAAGEGPKADPLRRGEEVGRRSSTATATDGAHLRDDLQRDRRLARAQAQRGRRRLVARAGRAVHARSRVHHLPRASDCKPEVLAVRVHERNIAEVNSLTIDEAIDFFGELTLTKREETIAHQVVKEIVERLTFLMDVGLDYLTLSPSLGDAVGRRGPAHPSGQSDRQLPRGRALRARRAVDRPAPARQPTTHRHARAACATSATR